MKMSVEPVLPPLAEDMPVDLKSAIAARRTMIIEGTCPLCGTELDLSEACAVLVLARDGHTRLVTAVPSRHAPGCDAGHPLVQQLILSQGVQ